MEIVELKKLKKELQSNISGQVFTLVEEFKKKSGVSPNSISVDMIYVNDMGHEPEYVVGQTRVDIEV